MKEKRWGLCRVCLLPSHRYPFNPETSLLSRSSWTSCLISFSTQVTSDCCGWRRMRPAWNGKKKAEYSLLLDLRNTLIWMVTAALYLNRLSGCKQRRREESSTSEMKSRKAVFKYVCLHLVQVHYYKCRGSLLPWDCLLQRDGTRGTPYFWK